MHVTRHACWEGLYTYMFNRACPPLSSSLLQMSVGRKVGSLRGPCCQACHVPLEGQPQQVLESHCLTQEKLSSSPSSTGRQCAGRACSECLFRRHMLTRGMFSLREAPSFPSKGRQRSKRPCPRFSSSFSFLLPMPD